MELSQYDKNIITSVLYTLIYNTFEELKNKLLLAQKQITPEAYDLMIYGDTKYSCFSGSGDKSLNEPQSIISSLEGRWSLKTLLQYHVERTRKISREQYQEIIN